MSAMRLFRRNKPEHTAEDVRDISVSRAGTNYDLSYFFRMKNTSDGWVFSAECFPEDCHGQIKLDDVLASQGDVCELFGMIRDSGMIESVTENKASDNTFTACDETEYLISLGFSDGKSVTAAVKPCNELKEFFYRIAAEYADGK